MNSVLHFINEIPEIFFIQNIQKEKIKKESVIKQGKKIRI